MSHPDVVETATAAYQADSDKLADFIDEACELDPDAEIGASELYAHYKQWAERNGLSERERLSATMFGTKAAERFERTKGRAGAVYHGLARRPV